MLELMARGGMRIGEVLKLTPDDINERKLTLREPKSGNELEFVNIPKKVANRLKEYIKEKGIYHDKRIFPICYEAARSVVPVEIISKVILRHANLSTTQRYLGKVSDSEAMRWIDNLYT